MKQQVSDARAAGCLPESPARLPRRGKPVVMVTPGHMACGAITAMRSLSGALSYCYRQEEAACRRPRRGGSGGGPGRCRPGHPGLGHALSHHACAGRHDPAGPGSGRRGHRGRPDRARALRGYPAFGQEARAESQLGVLTRRPARRTQGCPRARAGGEPGARRQPGNLRNPQEHGLPAAPSRHGAQPWPRGPGPLCSAQPAPDTRGADDGQQPRQRTEQQHPHRRMVQRRSQQRTECRPGRRRMERRPEPAPAGRRGGPR